MLIEHYFGHLCVFNLFESKWRWSEENYNQFLRFGVSVTKGQILWNLLRQDDEKMYTAFTDRLVSSGKSTTKKGAISQSSCKDRCKKRLSEPFNAEAGNELVNVGDLDDEQNSSSSKNHGSSDEDLQTTVGN